VQIDGAHCIFHGFDFEPVLHGIEHGVLHAVVRGQSTDHHFFDTRFV
jgi:hypothetical protein